MSILKMYMMVFYIQKFLLNTLGADIYENILFTFVLYFFVLFSELT